MREQQLKPAPASIFLIIKHSYVDRKTNQTKKALKKAQKLNIIVDVYSRALTIIIIIAAEAAALTYMLYTIMITTKTY